MSWHFSEYIGERSAIDNRNSKMQRKLLLNARHGHVIMHKKCTSTKKWVLAMNSTTISSFSAQLSPFLLSTDLGQLAHILIRSWYC